MRWRWQFWWVWPPAILLVLGLHWWFPTTESVILHDTYSPTAEGQRGFFELVESEALWTARNHQPLVKLMSYGAVDGTLCLLGPHREPTAAEWEAIWEWVAHGGRLLYACRGFENLTIPQVNVRYLPRTNLAPPNDDYPPLTELVSSPEIAWWTDGRLVAEEGQTLIEYDGTTQAIAGEYGQGRYVISAASLIFSNQLLTYGDNPALALQLLDQLGTEEGVTFDESLNAHATPQVMGLLFDPELRHLTLQVLLVTLLYCWWNAMRFGPYEESTSPPRRNIVDHTDAVGLLHWRARNGLASLRTYWQLVQSERRVRGLLGTTRIRTPATAALTESDVKTLQQEVEQQLPREAVDRRVAGRLIRRLALLRQTWLRSAERERPRSSW
jgi:hypothetical protein